MGNIVTAGTHEVKLISGKIPKVGSNHSKSDGRGEIRSSASL